MKRRPLILATILVLLGLSSAAGWFLLRTDRAPGPAAAAPDAVLAAPVRLARATDAEIDLLQAEAATACRCARRRHEGPEESPCYADFRRTLAGYEHEEWTSACMPSTTSECFRLGNGRERCISRDWGSDACSADEARILDAIDMDGERHPDAARQRHAAAVQSFIRGAHVPVPGHGGEGCAG